MPYFGIPIRNGLPIGLGSVAGFGVQQFSPADLFSAGEQGAWYDPSDLSTLFDDSAGTTPVSAPGNGADVWVGLMLDKSKGLVLGSELVTNGDFSNGTTGWTGTLTLAVVNGELQMTRTASGQDVSQIITTVAGQSYKISVSYRNGTTSSAIYIGSTAGGSNLLAVTTLSSATTQTFTAYFTATNTTSYIQFGLNALGGTAFIDNVTVKSIAGNHAFQTASAKRPKLAARYNLLTYTEQFDNGVWGSQQINVTQNAVLAPNGTLTADLCAPTTGNFAHRFVTSFAATSTNSDTFSIYAKAGGYDKVIFYFVGGTAASVQINLSTGVLSSAGYGNDLTSASTATNVGNGWYRITMPNGGAGNTGWWIYIEQASNFIGDGVSGVYLWGADRRFTSQATGLIGPTYQRVVDAATYDTVGFLPYLEFNGLSWSMSTNSIDFTATDKMTVWAGVRKLSDATLGILAETSAVANSNNGAFAIGAPGWSPVAARYGSLIKGTSANALFANSPNSFAAPITNVLAMQYDLAGASNSDVMKMRLNAASQSLTFFDGPASGGNFGNYPLFIGARNNASFFFTGWLTSLIVRGAQSTQSQIEATESWVNGKTGAY